MSDRVSDPSAFISRWQKASGSELANAQLFIVELCELLALPRPAELPAQMRALSELLAAARRPLSLTAIEAAFSGRGPWKARLPQRLDSRVTIGQLRVVGSGYASAR